MGMNFKSRRLWVPFGLAGLIIAGCNLPSPTAESPTEAAETILIEPTNRPSDVAASPSAAAASTADVAVEASTPEPRNLRIVYTDGGKLWALEVGSDPRQVIEAGSIGEVRLSDDGEWIAYTIRDSDQDTADLHSIRFDGSSPQVVLDAAGFDTLYPLEAFLHYTLSNLDFIPGTHTLLINTRGVFEGPGLAKIDDLLAVDVPTSRIKSMLAPGIGGDFTVSPTGDSIAIVRPDSIGFVNATGSDLRPEVLTFPPVITYSEFFFYPLPVWSGNSVVLPVPQEDPFFAAEPGTVWAIDGTPRTLARPVGDLFGPQRELPIVSPDGSSVAFLREADVAGDRDLVIQRLDNGEQTVYDTGPIQWRGWAPDSTRMVYSKGSGLDLYLGEIGAAPVPLGSGTGLRWVNADQYLYLAGRPGSWILTLADLAGGVTPLADPSGDFVAFDFAE